MEYDLNMFDEHYIYNGYVLVNEIYEDEDHRSNTWSWGKHVDGYIEDPQILKGLSSNSYASFNEVIENFHKKVDEKQK
jgi:hypothetical protein